MRTIVGVAVWLYMVVAILTEVATFYNIHVYSTVATVVTILATSQATAIILFFMQLREEPGPIRLFALIPIMFLAALLIAMLASLG